MDDDTPTVPIPRERLDMARRLDAKRARHSRKRGGADPAVLLAHVLAMFRRGERFQA